MKTDEKGRPLTYWGGLDKSKKQTAVEWLHEQFKAGFNYNIEEGYEKQRDVLFEQALEMEKEQSNDKIQKAIEKFEELQSKASSLKDVIYLGGVLSALEGIKNETFKQQEQ
jgi:ubiquitin